MRLLNYIEVEIENIEEIVVSTGTKNAPAVNFYLKNGFVKTGKTKIKNHLSLTNFKKQM